MKQLLYGPARRQRLGVAAGASSEMIEQEQESALLSDLVESDFSADQNIVEVSLCSYKALGLPSFDKENAPKKRRERVDRRIGLPPVQVKVSLNLVSCMKWAWCSTWPRTMCALAWAPP